jgi:hypothetical protein
MSDADYKAEAKQNFIASQLAYQTLKSKARKATSTDTPVQVVF